MARGQDFLDALLSDDERGGCVRHVAHLPPREGTTVPWPAWSDPDLVAGYAQRGVAQPWTHQAEAAQAIWAGSTTALATSTGSGKSLGFWLPLVTAIRAGHRAWQTAPGSITALHPPTALYLSPTKALAADQRTNLDALLSASGIHDVPADTCDGDTSVDARAWIQRHSDIVLTNPDFLHHSLLPGHRRWSRLLGSLRYVVVDEGHAFRGVLGAHVALVLRRLGRLARHHSPSGDAPVMVVASATSADPALGAARLTGTPREEVVTVSVDGSPTGSKTVVLWQPPVIATVTADLERHLERGLIDDRAPLGQPESATRVSGQNTGHASKAGGTDRTKGTDRSGPTDTAEADPSVAPRRRSVGAEAALLLTDLTAAGARSLAFTRSRRGAETVASDVRSRLGHRGSPHAEAVAAYRGGYLPEERRALEASLRSGKLRALATTNALELGVDISGLDTVITVGWPGSRTSVWQQAGRAGRAGSDGLVIFVAREDPLDTYLIEHPAALLDAPIEANVFDPANRYVLAPHLCAAAAELPLQTADLAELPTSAPAVIDELTEGGFLRRRRDGWYWTRPEHATDLTDLRGEGGQTVTIVDARTGAILGTMDGASADSVLHEGAVYIHQGTSYLVREYHVAEATAAVTPADVGFTTWARSRKSIKIVSEQTAHQWITPQGVVRWGFGDVEVTSQVTEYQRRRLQDRAVLGTFPLDLPEHSLTTTACWWSVPPELVAAAGLDSRSLPGALHAAEHASIGMLPLLATCDRADLGGLSTDMHVDTERPTVFVYDGSTGGAGFAEHGFSVARDWTHATLEALENCPCSEGCPACVQSPKCGNGNEPLDKQGARRLLRCLLAEFIAEANNQAHKIPD